MTQVQIFASNKLADVENSVNQFVKDHPDIHVIDVKYQSLLIPASFRDGMPVSFNINDRAMIIYEE